MMVRRSIVNVARYYQVVEAISVTSTSSVSTVVLYTGCHGKTSDCGRCGEILERGELVLVLVVRLYSGANGLPMT